MKTMLKMLCAAAAAVMVMSAVPAEASVWGWLERLSGPGPFDQRFAHIGVRALCPSRLDVRRPAQDAADSRRFTVWPAARTGETCVYWDIATFVSHADPFVGGTSDINATVWGFGVTTLMLSWLEVGAGIGHASFHVEATDISVGRWTLTPARLVLRPARLLCPEPKCHIKNQTVRGSLDVVKLYFKTDVIPGTLQSSDFGVIGNFRERYDAVSSWGILFDLSELLLGK